MYFSLHEIFNLIFQKLLHITQSYLFYSLSNYNNIKAKIT